MKKAEHGSALRAVHTPLPTMGRPQRIPLQEAPMHVRLLGAAALTACLAAAGCASSPYNDGYYGASAPPTLACYNDCGTVTRIEVVSGGSSVPNATGAVVGAVVGAAAGRELADDESKVAGTPRPRSAPWPARWPATRSRTGSRATAPT